MIINIGIDGLSKVCWGRIIIVVRVTKFILYGVNKPRIKQKYYQNLSSSSMRINYFTNFAVESVPAFYMRIN
jgi:hypothetical protein